MLASKTVLPAPTQTSHPTAPKQEARINNASPNTRLTRMVKQVREVLPQVPSTVIARDLSTWCLLPSLDINISSKQRLLSRWCCHLVWKETIFRGKASELEIERWLTLAMGTRLSEVIAKIHLFLNFLGLGNITTSLFNTCDRLYCLSHRFFFTVHHCFQSLTQSIKFIKVIAWDWGWGCPHSKWYDNDWSPGCFVW